MTTPVRPELDLTACPECGAPAEVLWRSALYSTDGPVEHARVMCVQRHFFFMPVAGLPTSPAAVRRAAPASRRTDG